METIDISITHRHWNTELERKRRGHKARLSVVIFKCFWWRILVVGLAVVIHVRMTQCIYMYVYLGIVLKVLYHSKGLISAIWFINFSPFVLLDSLSFSATSPIISVFKNPLTLIPEMHTFMLWVGSVSSFKNYYYMCIPTDSRYYTLYMYIATCMLMQCQYHIIYIMIVLAYSPPLVVKYMQIKVLQVQKTW